ncbi:hypothetical protein [Aestuariispira insulae]|nr:hypothetical protein [Aestuariispira insulae]
MAKRRMKWMALLLLMPVLTGCDTINWKDWVGNTLENLCDEARECKPGKQDPDEISRLD